MESNILAYAFYFLVVSILITHLLIHLNTVTKIKNSIFSTEIQRLIKIYKKGGVLNYKNKTISKDDGWVFFGDYFMKDDTNIDLKSLAKYTLKKNF